MKAIVKSVKARMCEKKDKSQKFKMIDIECDVINEKNEVRKYKYSSGAEFVKKYMEFCKMTSEKLVGSEVDVQLATRRYEDKEGNEKNYTFIKYLHCVDENGKRIIMPKDDDDSVSVGF